MPGIIAPIGIISMGAVKYAGHVAAVSFIQRRIPGGYVSPWLTGAARTVSTVIVGTALLVYSIQPPHDQNHLISPLVFYVGLLGPFRMGVWMLLLRIFFRDLDWQWPRSLKLAALGTVWSYVLDFLAILSVVVTGGVLLY